MLETVVMKEYLFVASHTQFICIKTTSCMKNRLHKYSVTKNKYRFTLTGQFWQ